MAATSYMYVPLHQYLSLYVGFTLLQIQVNTQQQTATFTHHAIAIYIWANNKYAPQIHECI